MNMESLNLAAPEFLIRLNGEYFLAELDGSTVTGTPVPSAAAHFSYSAADKLCDRLRQRGYPQVHEFFGHWQTSRLNLSLSASHQMLSPFLIIGLIATL